MFGSPSLQALLFTLSLENDDLFFHQSKQQPSFFFGPQTVLGEALSSSCQSERWLCVEGRHSEDSSVASWCGLSCRKWRFLLSSMFY